MESTVPAVDVVIPSYNYAHCLERCVSSVLRQEGVDVRILIIDDASSDNTMDVGAKLADTDARITYRRHSQNRGLVGTANEGLMDWAQSKYSILLSADDALTDGALYRAASVMDAHDDVGLAYGIALVVADDAEMAASETAAQDFNYQIISGPEFLAQSCRHWCGIASPTAVLRTEVQHRVGGLNPKFPHTCDMEIWMRFARETSFAAIHATQAFYRRHQENMSTAYMRRPLSDIREQLDTINAVLAGSQLPGQNDWIAQARDRMIVQAYWLAGLAFERGDRAAVRDCLAFAEEHRVSLLPPREWWRLQAKFALGPKLISLLRQQSNGTRSPKVYETFWKGKRFGWLPASGSIKSLGGLKAPRNANCA